MYSNSYNTCCGDDRFEPRSLLPALWVSVTSTLRVWWATRELSSNIMQERKDLSDLPDHVLRDIGIDRSEASAESRKGRDDLPPDRLRQLRLKHLSDRHY